MLMKFPVEFIEFTEVVDGKRVLKKDATQEQKQRYLEFRRKLDEAQKNLYIMEE